MVFVQISRQYMFVQDSSKSSFCDGFYFINLKKRDFRYDQQNKRGEEHHLQISNFKR